MTEIPTLADLAFIPYVDENGQLPEQFQGKVGIYAIFDQSQTLKFIGFSRDVFLSLRQHLVRCLSECYWIKVQTFDRPNRTLLETIRTAWIEENHLSIDNEAKWTEPIQVKSLMTDEERSTYESALDEFTQGKALKNVARRIEAGIMAQLKARNVQTEIRFNPKLKEEGLLDLK
ncbi:GIY-YIG nuclease family protein [Leptolyngbya sp. FACHB-17]|uniref:GIY-YIG nuclease family protein n=1 Tax=unclassified Leptolyngbya TaxID=2650499 RepID=UPI0016816171|nr:GIY-YIG nuclease family protein [Leptolyngbya sp. FACHB-17]MBD2081267.1 GIY-YIG nuclease family protein [Leptolyngbya sp. FACHB-17]